MPGASNRATQQRLPRVVELVGPAAAGKTTLAHVLSSRGKGIQIAADLALRNKEHMSIFFRHIGSLLPLFLHRHQSDRWFRWDELKAVIYLGAWVRVLQRPAKCQDEVLLLDHGPVFKLATLYAFGPEWLKDQKMTPWWDEMCELWAKNLHLIVWLDASDANLVERINARSQRHAVKGKSKQEAAAFLARYRIAYSYILRKLLASAGPTLVQFDTAQESIDQIATEVLAAIQTCGIHRAGIHSY